MRLDLCILFYLWRRPEATKMPRTLWTVRISNEDILMKIETKQSFIFRIIFIFSRILNFLFLVLSFLTSFLIALSHIPAHHSNHCVSINLLSSLLLHTSLLRSQWFVPNAKLSSRYSRGFKFMTLWKSVLANRN